MNEIEERLLSLVYTYGGLPVESTHTAWIEAMHFLEQRGLVCWYWVNDGAYHEAVWVTPSLRREALEWERETQLSRAGIRVLA